MENLLTAVSTSYSKLNDSSEEVSIQASKPVKAASKSLVKLSTPEEALEILRAEPSFEALRITLRYLTRGSTTSNFRIKDPSPAAAQIINTLVSETVPNFWTVLSETSSKSSPKIFKNAVERKLLLSCLTSVAGLNAILTHMKVLILETKEAKRSDGGQNPGEVLKDQLDFLDEILQGELLIAQLWNDMRAQPDGRKRALWREVTVLLGSGKLLNIAAEATSVITNAILPVKEANKWFADGNFYSLWLAQNILSWSKDLPELCEGPWKPLPEFLGKSLRLGYADVIVDIILRLLLGSKDDQKRFQTILDSLPSSDQRVFLDVALKALSKRHLSAAIAGEGPDWWKSDAGLISAAAGYLNNVVAEDETRKTQLIAWLTNLSCAGVGDNVRIRRAAIAVFSKSRYDMETILEKSLQQFGDQLYIKHAPSLQQEVHTQVLLLSAGYMQKMAPLKVSMILRSSLYLNAVSNRLGASSARARFLGMIVGEALSELGETPEKQMKFKIEELDSAEAQWYKYLTRVQDVIGPVELLGSGELEQGSKPKSSPHKKIPLRPAPLLRQTRVIAIEEVDNDEDDEAEDDDLIPYAKPDSDEEDSDDDPTLVQRNKPMAPVYIRDLIIYLRDTENYDRQKLALTSGSSLIRRKANFGTEVSAHVEELGTLFVGMQDKYDMENFQDMRLQGMVAVLVSQPATMAKWFGKTFFDGDYSVSQRASILTVLSVGARELGGYKEQNASLTTMKLDPENSFPSKRLPEKLHKVFANEQERKILQSPVDAITKKLSDTMIQPLAASLADKATGPDILKVRTFSSRLAVEARRKPPTTNALSAIVADSFFFPLTGRFFTHLKAHGSRNVIFEPYLLSSFVKTLSLVLHAGGTSTLQLPQMTREMWDLLLHLRTQGQADIAVAHALLFAFLTLLEINADKRRLAEAHAAELIETQAWVQMLFQRLGAGTDEDDQIRALAAAVLFRISEVIEAYQALLVGSLGGM